MRVNLFITGLVSVSFTSAQNDESTSTQVAPCLEKVGVRAIWPSSPEYNESAEPFNLRLQYKPAVIVVPKCTEQVQHAIVCAKECGYKVQPKSGGHSYASYSSGGKDGSMVIDLQEFQEIRGLISSSEELGPEEGGTYYEIGAGLRIGNLAHGLWEQGKRALPHGTCTGVGIGGHFTHGGYGHTSRNWGTSLDTIVGAEVVLADGTAVQASRKNYTDIFWAIRGAADSIGVVTKFQVKTQPAPESLTYFSLKWSDVFNETKEEFTSKFLHIQEFARNTSVVDERISFGIYLDGSTYNIGGTFFGTPSTFLATILPELLRTLSSPTSLTIKEYTWLDYLFLMSDKTNGTIQEPISSYTQHDNFFAKSITVPESAGVSPASLDATWDYIQQNAPAPTPYFVIINLYGGPGSAINSPDKKNFDYSAYKHRDSLWVFQLYGRQNADGSKTGHDSVPFINGLHDAITKAEPRTQWGAYLNYVDPSLSAGEAHALYYGEEVYGRLAEVKRKWDGEGVFWNPQAVGEGEE